MDPHSRRELMESMSKRSRQASASARVSNGKTLPFWTRFLCGGTSGGRLRPFFRRDAEGNVQGTESDEARHDENDRDDSQDDRPNPVDHFQAVEDHDRGGRGDPNEPVNRPHVGFHHSLLSEGQAPPSFNR